MSSMRTALKLVGWDTDDLLEARKQRVWRRAQERKNSADIHDETDAHTSSGARAYRQPFWLSRESKDATTVEATRRMARASAGCGARVPVARAAGRRARGASGGRARGAVAAAGHDADRSDGRPGLARLAQLARPAALPAQATILPHGLDAQKKGDTETAVLYAAAPRSSTRARSHRA
jgi:hypothetical protein